MAPDTEPHPNQEYADKVGASLPETVPPHVSPAELQAQQSTGQGGSVSTGGSTGTVPGTVRESDAADPSPDELRTLAQEYKRDTDASDEELLAQSKAAVATGDAAEPGAEEAPGAAPAEEPPADQPPAEPEQPAEEPPAQA